MEMKSYLALDQAEQWGGHLTGRRGEAHAILPSSGCLFLVHSLSLICLFPLSFPWAFILSHLWPCVRRTPGSVAQCPHLHTQSYSSVRKE